MNALLQQWDMAVIMLQIVAIDLLLGGDNAVVIAMACRKLPPQKRTKAIIIGTVGAILARVLLLALALYLLSLPWLKIVGALLLLWIGMKLVSNEEEESEVGSSASLWRTAITITVADVIMSLDNVLAVAAAEKGTLRWSPSAWRSAFRLSSRAVNWSWSCSPAFPPWCCWAECSSAGLPAQCWSAIPPFSNCFPPPGTAPRAWLAPSARCWCCLKDGAAAHGRRRKSSLAHDAADPDGVKFPALFFPFRAHLPYALY